MLLDKPWRTEAVILFGAAQLFCLCLGGILSSVLQNTGLAAFQPPDGFGVILLGTLSFQGATWVLLAIFLRHHQMTWRQAFGLGNDRIVHNLRLAVLVIIAFLPVAWLLQVISAEALEKLGRPAEDQAAVLLLVHAKSWWVRAYLGVFAVVIAPVAEEFLFRGVLYPFIRQLGYPRLAVFGVSFLFALIHLNAVIFAPLFVLALALTWLYENTGSLLAPIAAHSLFNAVNYAALFLVKNKFTEP
jgi:membrane protease YdiL (CAAX protease family)